jgi:predicted anti-sigma-YlaC factor YlaD
VTCQSVEDLLIEGGSLSNEVQAHLSDCVSCREYQETLSEQDRYLRELYEGVLAPSGFHSRVRATVAQGGPQPLSKLLDAIGFVAVGVIAVVLWWSLDISRAGLMYGAMLVLAASIGLGIKVYSDLNP